jgi:hypothetical protein
MTKDHYRVDYQLGSKTSLIKLSDGGSLTNLINLLEAYPACTSYYVYYQGKQMTRRSLGNTLLMKIREV